MLINLNRTDLVIGYKRAQRARHYLLAKWRSELLRTYTRRWNLYFQELTGYESRRDRYRKRTLPLLLLGLAAGLIAGLWLAWQGVCAGAVLIPTSIATGLGAFAYWLVLPGKPEPPEKPLEQSRRQAYTSPVKTSLFTDLVPGWWEGLAARIPFYEEVNRMAEQTQNWGLIGEFTFIRELDLVTGWDTLILHGLMPKRNDDLDVVVIGPKGLWYFEVKYVNAEFEWCDGVWSIWRVDRQSGSKEQLHMLEYPDAQWRRMRRETLAILDAKSPTIAEVKGGIVFAHPDARHHIQGPAPFRYGTLPEWMKAYREAPQLGGLTPEIVLHFTETLLKRHQLLNPDLQLTSMNYYLSDVIGQAEQKIQKWIEAPASSSS